MQLFKGVENYFTNSLLYQENNELLKQSLPDDFNSGNEADSESGEDVSAIFSIEPIVTYLDDFDCNNLVKMRVSGSLIKMLLLITLCILKMYLNLSILVLCICLYPSQNGMHAYRGHLSSLSRLLKRTSRQLYSAEAKLGLQHIGHRTMTWNPCNSFVMCGQHTT